MQTPSLLLCCVYATRPCLQHICIFQTCKACIYPGYFNFRAFTIWLIGFLQRCPYNAANFYANATSNAIYDVYLQHRMPHTNFTISSDASWQDCPDTGHSTIRYMIFHDGILIKAHSTMPTPIAMSMSKAKYISACSISMANTHHICMLIYSMA